jgi:hypothetical protein
MRIATKNYQQTFHLHVLIEAIWFQLATLFQVDEVIACLTINEHQAA